MKFCYGENSWFMLVVVNMYVCYVIVRTSLAQPVNVRSVNEATNQSPARILYSRFMKSIPAKISYDGNYPVGTSACSLDPIPPILSQRGWVLAAVSRDDFLDSLICGTCLRISVIDLTRNGDPDEIYAAVVDSCNACEKGEINLYAEGKRKLKANIQAIECLSSKSQDEELTAVVRQAENYTKIQIKNSILPVVGMEIFSQGRWTCLPHDSQNNYLISATESRRNSIQLRATSVAGETIGFLLNSAKLQGEFNIPNQFRTLSAARHSDKNEPSISCEHQTNLPWIRDFVITSEKETNLIDPNLASTTRNPMTALHHTDGQRMKPHEYFRNKSSNSNASFCKGKPDGNYRDSVDCGKFFLCAQGRTVIRKCPSILKYNPKEGSCDWPTNVNCGNDLISSEISENSKETDDEEVYTKKFINGKRLKQMQSRKNRQF